MKIATFVDVNLTRKSVCVDTLFIGNKFLTVQYELAPRRDRKILEAHMCDARNFRNRNAPGNATASPERADWFPISRGTGNFHSVEFETYVSNTELTPRI